MGKVDIMKPSKEFRNNKKIKDTSILRIVIFTFLLFPAGLFFLLMATVKATISGDNLQLIYIIFSLILLFIVIIGVLYPLEHKSQYLIATILSFIVIAIILMLLINYIPQMKELNENYEEVGSSSISGLQPGNIDYFILESILFTTITISILIIVISIYMYIKSPTGQDKSIFKTQHN